MTKPFTSPPDAIEALIRKLGAITSLSGEEQQAIRSLPVMLEDLPAQHDIAREGDRPTRCVLVGSGWLCRHKATDSGKRQILSLHITGDMPDLQSLLLHQMDHSLSTIAPSKVAFIRHDHLNELHRRNPELARKMWRETLVDAAAYREWLLGIGRRSAEEQMAHLFCEMLLRQHAIGLSEDHSCEMPLSQGDLADALGLSLVHVNRTLQSLRGTGFVSLARGRLTVHDWDGLQELSGFDATYLHLHDAARGDLGRTRRSAGGSAGRSG